MAQTHLLHHWNFPRARAGAKPRAIATLRYGALMARRASRIHQQSAMRHQRSAFGDAPRRTAGQHDEQVTKWGVNTCREPERGTTEVRSGDRQTGRAKARPSPPCTRRSLSVHKPEGTPAIQTGARSDTNAFKSAL